MVRTLTDIKRHYSLTLTLCVTPAVNNGVTWYGEEDASRLAGPRVDCLWPSPVARRSGAADRTARTRLGDRPQRHRKVDAAEDRQRRAGRGRRHGVAAAVVAGSAARAGRAARGQPLGLRCGRRRPHAPPRRRRSMAERASRRPGAVAA